MEQQLEQNFPTEPAQPTEADVIQIPQLQQISVTAQASDLVQQANRAVINNRDDADKVASLMHFINAALKKAGQEKKKWKAPVAETGKRIDELFNRITAPLEQAKQQLQVKADTWMKQEQERARKEAAEAAAKREAEALETASALESAGFAESADNVITDTGKSAAVAVATARPDISRGDYGGSMSSQVTWAFEVIDPALVPREFLVVNEAKIREYMQSTRTAAKQLATEEGYKGKAHAARVDELMEQSLGGMPGVRFFRDTKAAFRS